LQRVFNERRGGYNVSSKGSGGHSAASNGYCVLHEARRSLRHPNDVTSGSHLSMKIARHRLRPLLPARHGRLNLAAAPRLRTAAFVAAVAGAALAGCAGGGGSSGSGHATAQDLLALNHMQDASGAHTRELAPEEKQVITKAVSLSVVNPGQAQFRWPQIASTDEGSINYCGMVNAKSAYPAYSGWQAYIVEGSVSGGRLTSAVVGLIAGGKDTEIVRKMCKKYGLDPGGAG
jgi:hypothetical protein